MASQSAAHGRVRTLVVSDDSASRRRVYQVLARMPELAVVGMARDEYQALHRIAELRPELMFIDATGSLPEVVSLVERLGEQEPPVGAVVMCPDDAYGEEVAQDSIAAGAFDHVSLPRSWQAGDMGQLVQRLTPVVRAYARVNRKMTQESTKWNGKLIVIGISTGGPPALSRMLPRLPATLGAPVLIVQHMPAMFTRTLAESLNRSCELEVKEAESGEVALPGRIYIAPGGRHLMVRKSVYGEVQMVLTDDPPEHHCRPAVDYLFRSAAKHFADICIGVVMTGMGCDGAEGLKALKQAGAITLAQDRASSAIYGMPMEAFRAGAVDEVLSLDAIAPRLVQLAGAGKGTMA